ncbi:hypothetical protein C8J57DRAFT_1505556 [Mycena rebaudengoi]|nr:hypothetical protein C8J57DRAFT_1505556 [Mycena rebaudengoi]
MALEPRLSRTSRLPRPHVSPDTKPPLKRKPATEEGGEAVDPEEPAHLHKLQTNSFASVSTSTAVPSTRTGPHEPE